MDKIASFTINHDTLERGIYLSRTDGDIYTYDLRLKKPNMNDYLDNRALHTIEHLFATYVRNSEFRDSIIYFGPMGCRTGFYFIVRNLNENDLIKLIVDTFSFVANFVGDIPGSSKSECGNYLEHSLELAKKEANSYLEAIKGYKLDNLRYMK